MVEIICKRGRYFKLSDLDEYENYHGMICDYKVFFKSEIDNFKLHIKGFDASFFEIKLYIIPSF